MTKKITLIKSLSLVITLFCAVNFGLGQCSGGTVTWNGSWSGTPDLTTEVILNASFNTATNGGSFSACSLTVAIGTLNIADNDYVEVENDLTVDSGATISVQPYGSFIQNNDSGAVTNNGTISVSKDTAPLNNWFEYTYWSSPLSNATVGVALSDSDPDRRFVFNASQFNDAYAETNNDNVLVLGLQDDIDDEGDDWQWVNSSTIMQPGVGYAATHSEAAFIIPPGPFTPPQFRYTFTGGIGNVFNNGVYNIPVYRNDITSSDFNWNFLGNPYPSAIDVDAFMTQNMYPAGPLEGAVYFWSQNTAPSSTANGNQAYNFDTSDYAYYNGSGGTQGGDGLAPNGFIPSGQGFFVTFSDSYPTNSGTVLFNNAMRSISLSPDNSQFFKSSNTKGTSSANKLWVNLTSDNGVFNQILVAYIDGATNNDDGAYYDARKIVAPKAIAALYSTIENVDKKFAIQGKAASSITTDEVIDLGFKTSIDVPTLYTLSVAKKEGDFLTNNPIYLKDNLTNTLHDLSSCDYTFTSEVGEFNKRFEIVFSNKALATDDFNLDNSALKISQIGDSQVRFKASSNLNIKTVSVFDLLGRQLYALSGSHNEETYNLPKLKNAVFIAKVKLSNGSSITKKGVLK